MKISEKSQAGSSGLAVKVGAITSIRNGCAMKIAVKITNNQDTPLWENREKVTPTELAELWKAGAALSAVRKQSENQPITDKFERADCLMVCLPLRDGMLQAVLAADFTQRYATVAAYTDAECGGTLMLAFELPIPIEKAPIYRRLLCGLETIYAGATPHKIAEQGYGFPGVGKTMVFGNKLSVDAVGYLDKLGDDAIQVKKTGGAYVRSRVHVQRLDVMQLSDGNHWPLEQLPIDMDVFCPVHVDTRPTAVVHWFSDGTPGVQCACCQRTYAAPNTRQVYDFDRFDRVMRELAAIPVEPVDIGGGAIVQDNSITYLNERYLPSLPLTAGLTLVKSPKGSGKTEALVSYIKECKAKRFRVLLLGHRRALIQSMAERLGIAAYFIVEHDDNAGAMKDQKKRALLGIDGAGDATVPIATVDGSDYSDETEARYVRVAPKARFAICLDSLTELEPADDHYDVIIIDESEQVFSHLVGDTLRSGDRRRNVFALLSHYLRVAQHVVLLDADLNMISVDVACALLKPETQVKAIINEPTASLGEIHMYASKDQQTAELVKRVGMGEKCFVATNSVRTAEILQKLLATRFPDKSLALVTAKNSQQQSVQGLLRDITGHFERDLDVLIASPAIGTGIDITFRDRAGNHQTVVKNVFGVFQRNVVTHCDIDQQLMRVRHPAEVHVWVDPVPMNYETDVGCIRRELENSVRRQNYLLRYEDNGRPVFAGDEGLIGIWAQVQAATRGSKNRLAELFRALRLECGWKIVDVGHDSDAATSGKAALEAAKERRLEEREGRLIAAKKLEKTDADMLAERDQKGLALTDEQREALERNRIESFYREDISPALITFDEEGRMRKAVKRFECLASRREWSERKDDADARNRVVAFDRQRLLLQRELLMAVFTAAGIFDSEAHKFKLAAVVEKAGLIGFLDVLNKNRGQIESVFGTPLNADHVRNPVGQLKSLLELVGLALGDAQVEQAGGKKIRRYAIDEIRLKALLEVVKRRENKFIEDTALPEKDTVGRSKANVLQAYIEKLRLRNSQKAA